MYPWMDKYAALLTISCCNSIVIIDFTILWITSIDSSWSLGLIIYNTESLQTLWSLVFRGCGLVVPFPCSHVIVHKMYCSKCAANLCSTIPLLLIHKARLSSHNMLDRMQSEICKHSVENGSSFGMYLYPLFCGHEIWFWCQMCDKIYAAICSALIIAIVLWFVWITYLSTKWKQTMFSLQLYCK